VKNEKITKEIDGTEHELVDTTPVELDSPDPALTLWEQLADRDRSINHRGDAELILPFPRPAWADPDSDVTGRSVLSTGYASEPVRVKVSHGCGVDHGDRWEPASAIVSARKWGNQSECVNLTLSAVVGGEWDNMGASLTLAEALELADVLQAAVALFGGREK